ADGISTNETPATLYSLGGEPATRVTLPWCALARRRGRVGALFARRGGVTKQGSGADCIMSRCADAALSPPPGWPSRAWATDLPPRGGGKSRGTASYLFDGGAGGGIAAPTLIPVLYSVPASPRAPATTRSIPRPRAPPPLPRASYPRRRRIRRFPAATD